jgi:hypothetical protein
MSGRRNATLRRSHLPAWLGVACPLITAATIAGNSTARADQLGKVSPPAANAEASALPIDVSKLRLTWSDEFDGPLDVSAWGSAPGAVPTRWIAHTPWAGDFGEARFADPRAGFPFTIEAGVLRIEARASSVADTGKSKRRWSSGLLASADPRGRGFGQAYGYFEVRAKLPKGAGVWPAFWLATQRDFKDPKAALDGRIEIDVLEHYGHNAAAYHAALHVWSPKPHRAVTEKIAVPKGVLSAGFHTYGVKVEPRAITFYFDRRPVWNTPTPAEHKYPLIVLVNLALGGGWPIDTTPNPSFMYVDYVRVYADADAAATPSGAAPPSVQGS